MITETRLHLPDGVVLPCEHGYGVFAGISRQVPALHGSSVRVGPVKGRQIGNRQMVTTSSFIPIRGASIDVDCLNLFGMDVPVRCETVEIPLMRVFVARTVCIKNAFFPSQMAKHLPRWCAVRKKRTINVKGNQIVGFQVAAKPPSFADAVALVRDGIGGRGRFGAGFFVGVSM
jgi:hypothetical protein